MKFKEESITAIKEGDKIVFFAKGNELNDYAPIKIAESDANDQWAKIVVHKEELSKTTYKHSSIEISMICRRLKNKFFSEIERL